MYILASRTKGTLYIGMTNDLVRRVYEHRAGLVDGFSKTYGTKRLVYFEDTGDVLSAITREKQLKRWKRDWKIRLIEAFNPAWRDLYPEII